MLRNFFRWYLDPFSGGGSVTRPATDAELYAASHDGLIEMSDVREMIDAPEARVYLTHRPDLEDAIGAAGVMSMELEQSSLDMHQDWSGGVSIGGGGDEY